MSRKSLLAILFAVAFGFALMPISALADHTIILEDDQANPVEGVYVQIAVYTQGGWATANGYTDENGEFTNATMIPAIGQDYWQAVLIDPDWNFTQENNPCLINYPQTIKIIEVELVR